MLTRQLPPSALERATQPLDLRVRAINREVPPAVALVPGVQGPTTVPADEQVELMLSPGAATSGW